MKCIAKEYQNVRGGNAHKNSIEWLCDFVGKMNFVNVCSTCGHLSSTVPTSTQLSDKSNHLSNIYDCVNNLRKQILDIGKKMEELQRDFANKLAHPIGEGTEVDDAQSAASAPASTKKPTYAAVLFNDISNTIKTSVLEVLKSQRLNDQDSASGVMYGVYCRENQDVVSAQDILESIGYNGPIVRVRRMGRPDTTTGGDSKSSKPKYRPLKVELGTAADCRYVLSHAKWLNDNPATACVHIGSLLSRAELDKMKNLRQLCSDLNKNAQPDRRGRKRYFILSGKLMTHTDDGKLEQYQGGVTPSHQKN